MEAEVIDIFNDLKFRKKAFLLQTTFPSHLNPSVCKQADCESTSPSDHEEKLSWTASGWRRSLHFRSSKFKSHSSVPSVNGTVCRRRPSAERWGLKASSLRKPLRTPPTPVRTGQSSGGSLSRITTQQKSRPESGKHQPTSAWEDQEPGVDAVPHLKHQVAVSSHSQGGLQSGCVWSLKHRRNLDFKKYLQRILLKCADSARDPGLSHLQLNAEPREDQGSTTGAPTVALWAWRNISMI